jgi:hypothetical protein
MGRHLVDQRFDQIGWIVTDPRGKVVRPHKERGRVGPQGQHRAARMPCPRPPRGMRMMKPRTLARMGVV